MSRRGMFLIAHAPQHHYADQQYLKKVPGARHILPGQIATEVRK